MRNKPIRDALIRRFGGLGVRAVRRTRRSDLARLSSRGLVIPRVMEFSFHRNDRLTSTAYRAGFPHPLDPENTGKAALPLPACWYSDP